MAKETTIKAEGGVVLSKTIETRDWYAWNDLMPPRPDYFHIVGEVYVPNPGIVPYLFPKVPQGINPRIILLDLVLVQKPGIWPTVFVWAPARYDKVLGGFPYERAQVFYGAEIIADVPVEDIH